MDERVQVTLEEAFVLHCRHYRESSLILDVFSKNFGKCSVLAKGAHRPRSKFAGILQQFRLLRLSWCGKSDLCTLIDAELVWIVNLSGVSLYCGLYLNELLNRFLCKHDSHPGLFAFYQQTLSLIANSGEIEKSLRFFELRLLEEVGYGLQLEYETASGNPIDPDKIYGYSVENGPLEAMPGKNSIQGSTLISLRRNQLNSSVELREAKRLLRFVIDFHMGGKMLRSRSLFARRRKPDHPGIGI